MFSSLTAFAGIPTIVALSGTSLTTTALAAILAHFPTITGPIKVGNGSRIAANAVVVNDVPENATMVGIPAKAIRVGNKGKFRPYGVDQKVKDEK